MTVGFLLDTNVISELVRHPHGRLADRIAAVSEQHVCTSIIVAAELRYGAVRKASVRLAAQLEAVLAAIDVLAVPSLWLENSPLVIHEAFLAGVPVVGARIGGIG